jgi:hypothetical protein
MKNYPALLLILAAVLVLLFGLGSCAGGPSPQATPEAPPDQETPAEIPPEIQELFAVWEEAVRTRNRDLLGEVLSPDALVDFTERSGEQTAIHGLDAIAEFRLEFFGDLGPQENYELGELHWVEEPQEGRGSFGFRHPDTDISEWLHLVETDRWRIHIIEIALPQPGSWVTNRYQALLDQDGSGFLEDHEREELHRMTEELHRGPHEVANVVDEFFDGNHDGYLDRAEGERALEIHYSRALRFFRDFEPHAAAHSMDLNGDETVDDQELDRIYRFMTGKGEIPRERDQILHMAPWITFPDAVYQPVPRETSNLLDELADGNGDGVIDRKEQRIIMESLVPWQEVDNYLERAIDRKHDGLVHGSDVWLLLQDSVAGRGFVAAETDPPYVAQTPIDQLMDRDGDGVVDGTEIETVVSVMAGNWRRAGELSEGLQRLLDLDKDTEISAMEIEEAKGLLFLPRPVDPERPLDRRSDGNGDGHIDPGELGITAGVTNKGEIPPLDERVRITRRRDEAAETSPSATGSQKASRGSDYYRKLGTIQDKKLAFVRLHVGTEKVDGEAARGIEVFVENAFVNVGKVRVVDRANIQQILKEHEFQSSGVIDESTAVEIGKLSGADIIVIGSVNRVGTLFYLNIKLIAVESAEIIGSSISEAADANEFLDMANQAVYRLF